MPRLLSASFYFKNDSPLGIGLTFGPPGFSSSELEGMFTGDVVKDYFRASDEQLGTDIVATYFAQLHALAAEARQAPLSMSKAILVALNVMWLAERGFLEQSEFNGTMFIWSK